MSAKSQKLPRLNQKIKWFIPWAALLSASSFGGTLKPDKRPLCREEIIEKAAVLMISLLAQKVSVAVHEMVPKINGESS